MKRLPDVTRYFNNLNPSRRAIFLYGIIFSVIVCSGYSFVRFRIPLFEHGAILPDTGMFLLYLWIILFLDEFLVLFAKGSLPSLAVGAVKRASLYVIAFYALAALLLAVNGIAIQHVKILPARIAARSNPYHWSGNFGSVIVDRGGSAGGRQEILLASRSESMLFVGEDVEVVLRKGILFCDRVLEIRRNQEKYYRKMLKAAPDSLVALKGLVLVCSEQGRFDEAWKWYGLYAEKSADDEGIGTALSQRIVDSGQYALAAKLLKELIRKDRSYENLYTLGYALAWAGEKAEAAGYLREATKLDPADYRAFYSLGYVYRDTGQLADAKQAWSTVLTLIPHFPEVEKNLREVEYELKAKRGH